MTNPQKIDLDETVSTIVDNANTELNTWINDQIHNNDFLIAGIGTFVFGALLYLLRRIPRDLMSFIFRRTTILVTVNTDNSHYYDYLSYAFETKRTWLGKNYSLVTRGRYNSNEDFFSPGYGSMVSIFRRRLITITRAKEASDSDKFKELTNYRFFTFKKSLVAGFFETAKTKNIDTTKIKMYSTSREGWINETGKKTKRKRNSVFLPTEDLTYILSRIQWFLNNKKWYMDRGIPYKLGIIFHGEPGCGKTSLIHYLASELNHSIVYTSTEKISESYQSLETFEKMYIFEDVDTSLNIKNRNPRNLNKPTAIGEYEEDSTLNTANRKLGRKARKQAEKNQNIGDLAAATMKNVLNVFDGLLTPEGFIFILTTNHIEKLDAALLRKGRIDVHYEVPRLSQDCFRNMYISFYDGEGTELIDSLLKQITYTPTAGSVVQDIFMNATKEEAIVKLKEFYQ